jgi:hypothetical protein
VGEARFVKLPRLFEHLRDKESEYCWLVCPGQLPIVVMREVLSPGRWHVILNYWPGVAELADAPDSKSGGRKAVWVRPPPPGPFFRLTGRWRIC